MEIKGIVSLQYLKTLLLKEQRYIHLQIANLDVSDIKKKCLADTNISKDFEESFAKYQHQLDLIEFEYLKKLRINENLINAINHEIKKLEQK